MIDTLRFRIPGRAAETIHLEEDKEDLCVHILEVFTERTGRGHSVLVRCDKATARAICDKYREAFDHGDLPRGRRAEARVVLERLTYLLRGE